MNSNDRVLMEMKSQHMQICGQWFGPVLCWNCTNVSTLRFFFFFHLKPAAWAISFSAGS